MIPYFERDLLLRGKVVQPDGTALDRHVLVRKGIILSVSRERPPLATDAVYAELGPNDWVFPGLINLHTHTEYNILPLWYGADGAWDNRFAWRGKQIYKRAVGGSLKALQKIAPSRDIFPTVAELQSIIGGTTTLQEGQGLAQQTSRVKGNLICRNTANPEQFGIPAPRKIVSIIDMFAPGKSGPSPARGNPLESYLRRRKAGKIAATLAHLAEGRSGFARPDMGPDPYSRAEFEAFMKHPAMTDADGVRSSPFSLIHACGADTQDPDHLRFLRDRGISVIWSPISNLILYGDTIDAETLLQAGINVALGSDWSPSGSKHLWDEAKFARFYLQAAGALITDLQIFQMVTSNAARCLGINTLGRIAEGCAADFFILRSPVESDAPLEVFFKTTDRDVRAVIVGGRPVYGNRGFLERFNVPIQSLPRQEGYAAEDKAVHLPARFKIRLPWDLPALEDALKKLPVPKDAPKDFKWRRSNLLVDADTPYKDRIQQLRGTIVAYGWKVQRLRAERLHGGPRVDVPPDCVRVWRGVKSAHISRKVFLDKLKSDFIPSTIRLQSPLGLTAYLPAVPPHRRGSNGIPDEIALVFYESKEIYQATFDTLGGRIYRDLHGLVFSKRSASDFPTLLRGPVKADKPYYLLERPADWHNGLTRLLIGMRKKGQSEAAFLEAVGSLCQARQKAAPDGMDGAILFASSQYILYWEHWEPRARGDGWLKNRLGSAVQTVQCTSAQRLRDPSVSLSTPSAGVPSAASRASTS